MRKVWTPGQQWLESKTPGREVWPVVWADLGTGALTPTLAHVPHPTPPGPLRWNDLGSRVLHSSHWMRGCLNVTDSLSWRKGALCAREGRFLLTGEELGIQGAGDGWLTALASWGSDEGGGHRPAGCHHLKWLWPVILLGWPGTTPVEPR